MADTKEKVICPWCKEEMRPYPHKGYYWFQCKCGAKSPPLWHSTEERAREKALSYTADVVPKSEYNAAIIDRNAARLGMIAEHERLKTAKAEVAREIFEEIYKTMNDLYSRVQHSMVGMHGDSPETMRLLGKLDGIVYLGDEIAELKKKYTEGET